MNIVENVAAGLVLALLLWLTRCVRARWRHCVRPSLLPLAHLLEPLMSKPLPKPDLLPGPHRQLNDLLHELHSRANYPSMRSIARVMGVSPTTLSDTMTKERRPTKDTAVRLALALAAQIKWGPGVDSDEELDKIDRRVADLWERARREAAPPEPDSVAHAVKETWESFACGGGPWPQVPREVVDAMNKATFEGGSVSTHGWVDVFATAHDENTYFALDCQADGTLDSSWRQEFETAVSHRLGKLVDVHVHLLEDFEWS